MKWKIFSSESRSVFQNSEPKPQFVRKIMKTLHIEMKSRKNEMKVFLIDLPIQYEGCKWDENQNQSPIASPLGEKRDEKPKQCHPPIVEISDVTNDIEKSISTKEEKVDTRVQERINELLKLHNIPNGGSLFKDCIKVNHRLNRFFVLITKRKRNPMR